MLVTGVHSLLTSPWGSLDFPDSKGRGVAFTILKCMYDQLTLQVKPPSQHPSSEWVVESW